MGVGGLGITATPLLFFTMTQYSSVLFGKEVGLQQILRLVSGPIGELFPLPFNLVGRDCLAVLRYHFMHKPIQYHSVYDVWHGFGLLPGNDCGASHDSKQVLSIIICPLDD